MNRRGNSVRGRGRNNNNFSTVHLKKNFVTPNQLRRQTTGFIPRGPFDPPRVVSSPWNQLVLSSAGVEADAGITAFVVSGMATVLKNQIGLPTTVDLFMRFLRLSLWTSVSDAVGGTLNLALQPSHLQSLSRTANHPWIEDIGTPVRPAHVHFIWPRNEQDFVFHSKDDASIVLAHFDHGANFSYYLHCHVLWRPVGGDPIPTRTRNKVSDDFVVITS